ARDEHPEVGSLVAGGGGIAGDEARLGVDREGLDGAGVDAIVAAGKRADLGHDVTPFAVFQARDHRGLVAIRSPGTAAPHLQGRSASGGRQEPSFLSREERRSRGEEGRRRRCGEEAGSKTASWGRSAHKGPLVAAATPPPMENTPRSSDYRNDRDRD